MTTAEALILLKSKMSMPDGQAKNSAALSALNSACAFINGFGEYKWNQSEITGTLTVGTYKYALTDLFPTENIRLIYDERLFFTGETGEIDIIDRLEFNQMRRGNTQSGKPTHATIHSNKGYIEFYPTPNAAYPIWGFAGVRGAQIELYPDEIQSLILILAILFVVSNDKEGMQILATVTPVWNKGLENLENTKYWTASDRSRIREDEFPLGNDGAYSGVDSNNPFGNPL